MVTAYKTPGVYIEEISKFPPSVAAVETAIPAFVGYTEFAKKGEEDLSKKPTRITSLLEYERFFGGAKGEEELQATIDTTEGEVTVSVAFADEAKASKHNLYYSMQTYFANGGGPCYIVSVGKLEETLKREDFEGGIDALANEDEPTLIVFPEAQNLADSDELFALIDHGLLQCEKLQDRFVIADLHHTGKGLTTSGEVAAETKKFRDKVTKALRYGAVYFPNVKTVFDYRYEDSKVKLKYKPEAAAGEGQPGPAASAATLDALKTENGDLYARVTQALSNEPVAIPPSGAVAGVYAYVDRTRGVWKAPANVGLASVSGLTFKVTDEIQENLNVDTTAGKSINAIRAFTGRGILVWGARTLDGNSNEWRYISVRRFFNMVEESTKKASGRFVFEPNDANTWVKVRAMIENFLLLQWRAGALAGAKPEQAFYVKVGLGETMTALDILEGRMNVEIGMAVVRPAEFIILKFSHKMQES